MSIRIMSRLWDADLNSTEKLVALALADHADDRGVCWPGQVGIAKKCGMSDRTVIRSIKSLENKNILKVERRIDPGTGHKLNNIYYFLPGDKVAHGPGDKQGRSQVTEDHINHQSNHQYKKKEKAHALSTAVAENQKLISTKWKPSDRVLEKISDRGLPDPDKKTINKFISYYRKKKIVLTSPDGAFLSWCIRSDKFKDQKQKARSSVENQSRRTADDELSEYEKGLSEKIQSGEMPKSLKTMVESAKQEKEPA